MQALKILRYRGSHHNWKTIYQHGFPIYQHGFPIYQHGFPIYQHGFPIYQHGFHSQIVPASASLCVERGTHFEEYARKEKLEKVANLDFPPSRGDMLLELLLCFLTTATWPHDKFYATARTAITTQTNTIELQGLEN